MDKLFENSGDFDNSSRLLNKRIPTVTHDTFCTKFNLSAEASSSMLAFAGARCSGPRMTMPP